MNAEPKITLEGDIPRAAKFVRFGQKILSEVRRDMELNSLFQLVRSVPLPGGGSVFINVSGALSHINVFMPILEDEIVEEEILAEGAAKYVIVVYAHNGTNEYGIMWDITNDRYHYIYDESGSRVEYPAVWSDISAYVADRKFSEDDGYTPVERIIYPAIGPQKYDVDAATGGVSGWGAVRGRPTTCVDIDNSDSYQGWNQILTTAGYGSNLYYTLARNYVITNTCAGNTGNTHAEYRRRLTYDVTGYYCDLFTDVMDTVSTDTYLPGSYVVGTPSGWYDGNGWEAQVGKSNVIAKGYFTDDVQYEILITQQVTNQVHHWHEYDLNRMPEGRYNPDMRHVWHRDVLGYGYHSDCICTNNIYLGDVALATNYDPREQRPERTEFETAINSFLSDIQANYQLVTWNTYLLDLDKEFDA